MKEKWRWERPKEIPSYRTSKSRDDVAKEDRAGEDWKESEARIG